MAAHELHSGARLEAWMDGRHPPDLLELGPDDLLVAFAAQAEISCLISLGWGLPGHVLDLRPEFLMQAGGRRRGGGLLDALAHYGLGGDHAAQQAARVKKNRMHARAVKGGDFSPHEAAEMTAYCASDVDALLLLLPIVMAGVDLGVALDRGEDVRAATSVELAGIPVDVSFWQRLTDIGVWERLRWLVAAEVELIFPGVYIGVGFHVRHFERWLRGRNALDWPRTRTGLPKLDDDTLHEMQGRYPELRLLRQARQFVRWRVPPLEIGRDGRARCMSWPFGTKTGRNSPSSSKFLLMMPAWIRSIITPQPGTALIYADYKAAELGIAAGLSGDLAMQACYRAPDPYIHFAELAGRWPKGATKDTHLDLRNSYKKCCLAVGYGQQAHSLARALGIQLPFAEELLELHHEIFWRFWQWSESISHDFNETLSLATPSGWRWSHALPESEPWRIAKVDRTARNFPVQGAGSDLLRVALRALIEAGVKVIATVHDAFLVECDLGLVDFTQHVVQTIMEAASSLVMDTPQFSLRSDVMLILPGQRFRDARGAAMWTIVCDKLGVAP